LLKIARDVQSESALAPFELDWVSVTDIHIPVNESGLNGLKFAISPVVDAAVDLPASQRGIHASRTYECVKEAAALLDGVGFYGLAERIARSLLEKHTYSTRARVSVRARLFETAKTPISYVDSVEHFNASIHTFAVRGSHTIHVSNFVGVEATGITACPCAKEVIRELYQRVNGEVKEGTPLATHMQRSHGRLIVESDGSITFTQLLDILHNSFSSRTLELLKRPDEAALVLSAVEKPRFVEDVVRHAAKNVVEKFQHLPDSYRVYIKVRALESIHSHNLESQLKSNLGILRQRIGAVKMA
jgi:GTP cyclohydrolase-4